MKNTLIVVLVAAFSFVCIVTGLEARAQSQGAVKVLDEKAREALALKIQKNVRISVFAYRKDADAYVIKIEAEPDVGPNTTTAEWLLHAVDNGTTEKDIKRNPNRIVGSLFRLKNDLWLLSDEEIGERQAKLAKK